MTEPQPSESVSPGDYGRQRAEAWRAHLEASHAASTAAELEAHRAVSADLRAAHRGLYDMTPQELGADVQARDAEVGSAFGGHQQVERLGGTLDWRQYTDSPVPAMVDRRPKRPGYTRIEHPLKDRGRG